FFQAEDGIRDFHVTGVQTCALPICLAPWTRAMADDAVPFDASTVPALARELAARPFRPPSRELPAALDAIDYDAFRDYRFRSDRSEERRVGKGGRTRWGASDCRKDE